jgi:hypothetical protein
MGVVFGFLVIYGETIYHFLFLMELMCEVVMFVFSLSLPARLVNQEISFKRLPVSYNPNRLR